MMPIQHQNLIQCTTLANTDNSSILKREVVISF